MNGTITLVVENADIDHVKRLWKLDELARELVKAGCTAAPLFHGRLEEAPESTAYIVFAHREDLGQRRETPGMRDRLARSVGTDGNLKNACRVAMELGLAANLPDRPLSWGHEHGSKGTSACGVRRDIAQGLHWAVWDVNDSDTHAFTKTLPTTMAELLVTYLAAAVPVKP